MQRKTAHIKLILTYILTGVGDTVYVQTTKLPYTACLLLGASKLLLDSYSVVYYLLTYSVTAYVHTWTGIEFKYYIMFIVCYILNHSCGNSVPCTLVRRQIQPSALPHAVYAS